MTLEHKLKIVIKPMKTLINKTIIMFVATIVMGIATGIYFSHSKVANIQHIRSDDNRHVISIIDTRGDGGIDYQILRYIVAKDTNSPPKSNRVNQIILPDSGSIKLVWHLPNELHIFTEECCEFVLRGRKQELCSDSTCLTTFGENLDVILHARIDYVDGPKKLIGADVKEL